MTDPRGRRGRIVPSDERYRRDRHRVENMRTGLRPDEYGVIDIIEAIGRMDLPTVEDCTWHTDQGIPYLTSGRCGGPDCLAYLEAHADDRVDA